MTDKEKTSQVNAELDVFLSESENLPASEELSKRLNETKRKIKSSLVESPAKLFRVYVLSSFFGYLASLTVCEQNTVGVGKFAENISAAMCGLGMPWCWLACGTLFSAFPIAATHVFLTKFEQRYLYRHMWYLVLLTPFVASLLMLLLPRLFGAQDSPGTMEMMMLRSPEAIAWWICGAIVTPYVIEYVVARALRQKTWSAS